MNLNKAIENLKNKVENWNKCKKDICSVGELYEDINEENIAIDTVLNELDNRNKRIYKLEKNIEFIINKIVNKAKTYQYHTKITAGTNIETNIGQQILTELLEEIKKEI